MNKFDNHLIASHQLCFSTFIYFSFFYIKHSKWLFFRSIFAMEFMPMFAYVTKYATTLNTLPLVIIIINQKRQYVRIRTVFCKPPGIPFLNFSSFHIFITLYSKCLLSTEYTIQKKRILWTLAAIFRLIYDSAPTSDAYLLAHFYTNHS